MDFNRVFSQAISRTVNKCYAEESEISVAPFLHWSFNPLIPPGCIPFIELAGLESVVERVINQMNAEDEDEEADDREEETMEEDSDWSEVDSVDAAPDIEHAECSKCGKDFSPAWTKIKNKVYCIACMKNNSRVGIIEENQERMTRIVSKVEEQIKAMETAQAEKLNELEERKARKNKIKTTLKECKKSNIIYPQIITDLTQNNLSLEKKRELISLAADQILARLRIDKMRHLAKPPPLDAKIETMDDLLKFC